jgi:hypothetical protein
MKLSEAIRCGAKLRPQSGGNFFAYTNRYDEEIGSCTLGAAAEALGAIACPTMECMKAAETMLLNNFSAELYSPTSFPDELAGELDEDVVGLKSLEGESSGASDHTVVPQKFVRRCGQFSGGVRQ